MNTSHDLNRALEDHLAERAEELLRARAKKVGMKPRELLRQAAPEVAKPDNEKSAIVQTLLQRLAERD